MIKRLLILTLLIASTISLSACETTKGVGRDLQALGKTISGE